MKTHNISRVFLLSSLFAVSAAAHASTADLIVGSWLGEAGGNYFATSFLADGRYIEASVIAGDPVHTGIEWGTYSWNSTTGMITASSMGDTNGNWGFANDVDGPQYMSVSGNTGTVFQPGCPSCTVSASRILPSSPAIIGSWLAEPGSNLLVASFLADGRYIEASVIAGDPVHTGIEWGTYSWNSTTGMITASSMGDTNGNWGFANDVDGPQYMSVSGNTGTVFQPGCPSCAFSASRIMPAAVPVPAAAWLLGSGLLGLIGVARRKAA